MRLEFSIDIHRPLREVFTVVGNLENDPKWQSAVITVNKLTAGPIGVGTRFRHGMKIMGRRGILDVKIVSYEPYQRYALHCIYGPLNFGTEVRFERMPQGTRCVTLIDGQPKGLLKVAAITLSNYRRLEIEADLRNLKQLMESGAL